MSDELINVDILGGTSHILQRNRDKNTMTYLSFLLTNMTYNNDSIKLALHKDGLPQVLIGYTEISCEQGFLKALGSILSAMNNLISIKSICNDVVLSNQDFMKKLCDLFGKYTSHKDLVISMLMVLQNILKFAETKHMRELIESGLCEWLIEVYLEWKEDDDVIRQFLFTISEITSHTSFWDRMESYELSGDIFAKMSEYKKDLMGPCLNCLYFLSKLPRVSNRIVANKEYDVLDKMYKSNKLADSQVILLLLTMSNLVSNKVNQSLLNEDDFHLKLESYYSKIEKIDLETHNAKKLYLVWANIMTKLTNSSKVCNHVAEHMAPKIFKLVNQHFDHKQIFQKSYNLLTNVCIGLDKNPNNFVGGTIDLSLKKFETNYDQMFLVTYINFLQHGLTKSPHIQETCKKNRSKILDSIKSVPLIIKTSVQSIHKFFNVKERKVNKEETKTVYMNLGVYKTVSKSEEVYRYRPGGTMVPGTFVVTSDLKRLMFKRHGWVSVDPEDTIKISQILKLITGFDGKETPYNTALERRDKTFHITEKACLTLYGLKVARGESGFYVEFESEATKIRWKEALRYVMNNLKLDVNDQVKKKA